MSASKNPTSSVMVDPVKTVSTIMQAAKKQEKSNVISPSTLGPHGKSGRKGLGENIDTGA